MGATLQKHTISDTDILQMKEVVFVSTGWEKLLGGHGDKPTTNIILSGKNMPGVNDNCFFMISVCHISTNNKYQIS